MPNPYHYRSFINRLARQAGQSNPGYVRLRALTALLRELAPTNPRSAENIRLFQAVDAFDYARHTLRDLYDRAPLPASISEPGLVPAGSGPAALNLLTEEEQLAEEDDDPL